MALRRSDAIANQARVLDAARAVFAEQGTDAEIKDIADRAGVGVATIYRGFGSKNDLLKATIRQAYDWIADNLDAAEREPDAVEALRRLIVGSLSFIDSYGWLVQACLRDEYLRDLEPAAGRRAHHEERVAGIIRRGIESGDYSPDLPVQTVLLLIKGAVFALSFGSHQDEPGPDPASIADGIIRLLTATSGSAGRLVRHVAID